MLKIMVKSRIRKARVTDVRPMDEDGLIIDDTLIRAAGMAPHERVQVSDHDAGEVIETVLIKGVRDRGEVIVGGAAALRIKAGNRLTITSFALMEQEEVDFFTPRILILDEKNKIAELQ